MSSIENLERPSWTDFLCSIEKISSRDSWKRDSLHHPYPEDIYWLIEVANTSFDYDISTKKRIYAEAEIREYWVVNLNTAELIVFREPLKNDYAIKMPWNSATISPLAFPDVNIVLEILLN